MEAYCYYWTERCLFRSTASSPNFFVKHMAILVPEDESYLEGCMCEIAYAKSVQFRRKQWKSLLKIRKHDFKKWNNYCFLKLLANKIHIGICSPWKVCIGWEIDHTCLFKIQFSKDFGMNSHLELEQLKMKWETSNESHKSPWWNWPKTIFES